MERSIIIDKLVEYSIQIPQIAVEIQRKYNLSDDDSRITFFGKIQSVLYSDTFISILVNENLFRDEWWQQVPFQYKFKVDTDPKILRRIIDRLDLVLGLSYLHFIFSAMESSIRSIVKAIDPTEYDKIKKSYKTVICYLLQKLRIQESYSEFIKILIPLRNAIHNNGVYSPLYSNNNIEIEYKNITYLFVVDKLIDTIDFWQLLFHLTDDIVAIFNELARSDFINIRYIKDKSYIP